MTRCDWDGCRRPYGHRGDCRLSYRSLPLCGALMPLVNEPCTRTAGHGYEHRSRYAMDNAMDRARLAQEAHR